MSFTTPSRRHFILGASAAAMAGITPAAAAGLPFRYAFSAISWKEDVEEAVNVAQRLGFPGVEPFRHNVLRYLDRPLALKKYMDDRNVRMATCSNGGGPNFTTNFFDPAKVDQSVKDHIAFARDFIKPFGYCNHFKMNMGPRPPGYDTNDEQIKRCADAMNRIGRETIKMGLRLAPHPHVNSLVQTQHEVDLLMKETNPDWVWMTADTAHLVLGGIDPMELLTTYWPRIAEIHYKDAPRNLRGNRKVAVPRSGPEAGGHGWFRSMVGPDSGGVDFPRIQKFLIDKKYNGWVTLDYDASMVPPGSNMEAFLITNKKYLVDTLKVDPKASLSGFRGS